MRIQSWWMSFQSYSLKLFTISFQTMDILKPYVFILVGFWVVDWRHAVTRQCFDFCCGREPLLN